MKSDRLTEALMKELNEEEQIWTFHWGRKNVTIHYPDKTKEAVEYMLNKFEQFAPYVTAFNDYYNEKEGYGVYIGFKIYGFAIQASYSIKDLDTPTYSQIKTEGVIRIEEDTSEYLQLLKCIYNF